MRPAAANARRIERRPDRAAIRTARAGRSEGRTASALASSRRVHDGSKGHLQGVGATLMVAPRKAPGRGSVSPSRERRERPSLALRSGAPAAATAAASLPRRIRRKHEGAPRGAPSPKSNETTRRRLHLLHFADVHPGRPHLAVLLDRLLVNDLPFFQLAALDLGRVVPVVGRSLPAASLTISDFSAMSTLVILPSIGCRPSCRRPRTRRPPDTEPPPPKEPQPSSSIPPARAPPEAASDKWSGHHAPGRVTDPVGPGPRPTSQSAARYLRSSVEIGPGPSSARDISKHTANGEV